MASEQYDGVFEESQDDDEEPSSSDNDLDENDDVLNGNDDVLNDEEDEELLEEEEDINSPSLLPQTPVAAVSSAVSSVAIPVVPVAVPSATAVTIAAVSTDESPPDSKRQRVESAITEKKPAPPSQFDESRRLFQRLWTDEDEIELLQGFLDYSTSKMTSNSSSSHHHHHDTALFYDQIKSKLQLDFNKNQLVEKLRRLKKKYRNVMNKISSGRGISGLAMNAMPLNFGGSLNFGVGGANGELMDERWRRQQILELEVYSKRLELVQDQIKAALEELRSMGG
ncbi:hypothetical protein CCACVL1_22916 [Corchorus capsularis]|uniref:Glabrous enhancer-binding protein-like DBD domain-containing protein n=1 Tax=Corchorus capsularis TaxID=210143 RepID=A0A1R3GVY3_COCAP|nr:hypothetical protein CCACVL1_22916 [Corchorus capsularis]